MKQGEVVAEAIGTCIYCGDKVAPELLYCSPKCRVYWHNLKSLIKRHVASRKSHNVEPLIKEA